MLKALSLLLALASVASSVEASPHPRLKKIATAVFIVGMTEGAAWAKTIEVSKCRQRNGPEKCEARYGAWKQTQVFDHGFAGAMIAVTYALKHAEEKNDDRFKTWYFVPLATGAWFSWRAADQAGKETHCSAGKRFNGIECE